MEKGEYSINDLKGLFKLFNFNVGEILYFRNPDLAKRFGSMYDIEIKVKVMSVHTDKLFVQCDSYYDNHNKKYVLSFDTPHIVDKNDFKSLYRNPKYY